MLSRSNIEVGIFVKDVGGRDYLEGKRGIAMLKLCTVKNTLLKLSGRKMLDHDWKPDIVCTHK